MINTRLPHEKVGMKWSTPPPSSRSLNVSSRMKGISPYASSLLPPSPTFDLRLITTDCQPIYLIVFYQPIHYQAHYAAIMPLCTVHKPTSTVTSTIWFTLATIALSPPHTSISTIRILNNACISHTCYATRTSPIALCLYIRISFV